MVNLVAQALLQAARTARLHLQKIALVAQVQPQTVSQIQSMCPQANHQLKAKILNKLPTKIKIPHQ